MTRSWAATVSALLVLLAGACKQASSTHNGAEHDGHTAAQPVSAPSPKDEHAGMAHGDSNAPAGYAPITLEAGRARAIGLRTEAVAEREFSKRVRTTGVVTLDETRTSHVHAKVRGWIENVSVDFVGKSVVAGAPLCTIYSQEVLAAQLEFLSILDQGSNAVQPSGAFAGAEKRAREQLLAAARRRLALWDVPASEIARLEATREPRRTFTLAAPRTGVVVAKQALAGMFIDPAVELYLISDIRKLWVLADIYESDIPGLELGDSASLSIEGVEGRRSAAVAFVPPTVEEATRTLRIRFDLDNQDRTIRPGTFATVELDIELGRSLAVPEAAVIHAGRQSIVFAVQGERIEPRNVELGAVVEGFYAVKSGVIAGESVAVGAQFLIDSESRLRATSGQGPSHGGH